MSMRLAAVLAIIAVLRGFAGIIYVQHQQLAAADERIVDLEGDLATANASIANLRSRSTTDAKVCSMSAEKVRKELSEWAL